MKRNNHWNTLWTLPIVALKAITAAQRGNGKLPPSLVSWHFWVLAPTNNTASKWSLPNTFWIPNSKGSGTLAGLGCTNGSTPIACHSCLHWPLFSVLYQELRPVPQPPLPLQSPTCPKVSANMEVSKNKQLTHDTYWKHLKAITFALDANVNAYGAKLD